MRPRPAGLADMIRCALPLLGLWTLDFNVGRDHRYGPSDAAGPTFSTRLNPARRRATDLWNFTACLEGLGWGL